MEWTSSGPQVDRRPVAFIINTDSVNEPGEHWVALYLCCDETAIYFDPFGLPPIHKDFTNFIKQNSPRGLLYSSLSSQNMFSTLCGWYCIEFVKAMNKKSSLSQFLKQFKRCTLCNDAQLKTKLNIPDNE